jgi:hypothetical protein
MSNCRIAEAWFAAHQAAWLEDRKIKEEGKNI